MKVSLNDYKTESFNVDIDGEQGAIVVRSLASREYKEALSVYLATIDYAKENNIELEQDVTVELGFDGLTSTRKEKTEFAKKAYTALLVKLIADWPFKIDAFECLLESDELATQVDVIASKLSNDFKSKKKI